MNDTTEYNGWSNRETWLVGVWISNSASSYSLLNQALEQDNGNIDKAEWLRCQFDDELNYLELDNGMWADLLTYSLTKVNWLELIENN